MNKTYSVLLILILCLFMCLGRCYADPLDIKDLNNYNFEDMNNIPNQTFSSTKSVISFFVYLLLLILISVLAFFTTKWLAKYQTKLHIKSKYMEVVDRLLLGNNRGIYIIKTPKGMFLVGVCDNGINIIHELGNEETELINEAELSTTFQGGNFSEQLEHYLKKIKKPLLWRNNGDEK
jgi:flagellar biogenesis protein FliO